MEVLSAVRSFFPINLKCGISMSLLVISVIHTNTTLKAPRVLLMGKNMLGHLLLNTIGSNIGINKLFVNNLMIIGNKLSIKYEHTNNDKCVRIMIICIKMIDNEVRTIWPSIYTKKHLLISTMYGVKVSIIQRVYDINPSKSNLYPKSCNHKRISSYYLLTSLIFGISGIIISLMIRIELDTSSNRIIQ